ncbi:hypothetical protein XBP1_1540003 [Xenorhabdus bovienii str. puntauvense]|uniref:Uncharacterized protein n=1 Tax=Xenorhabdus bovienii str. puntauvense TaxID=1398201 RepID=A0A077N0Z0_XENBV|nr:hypothetical protein XBFFR1_1340003 [Xenorhabdus bovienii str. feltiae France]CDG92180.1 hypothetical protein XBFFL1_2030003 [Xenorhabdus bovienii str. feltiae Florida]CDG95736.1 hypothetical protein XBP1_1540003 [Xenorhabdus bovienii str. puntauvense]
MLFLLVFIQIFIHRKMFIFGQVEIGKTYKQRKSHENKKQVRCYLKAQNRGELILSD